MIEQLSLVEKTVKGDVLSCLVIQLFQTLELDSVVK